MDYPAYLIATVETITHLKELVEKIPPWQEELPKKNLNIRYLTEHLNHIIILMSRFDWLIIDQGAYFNYILNTFSHQQTSFWDSQEQSLKEFQNLLTLSRSTKALPMERLTEIVVDNLSHLKDQTNTPAILCNFEASLSDIRRVSHQATPLTPRQKRNAIRHLICGLDALYDGVEKIQKEQSPHRLTILSVFDTLRNLLGKKTYLYSPLLFSLLQKEISESDDETRRQTFLINLILPHCYLNLRNDIEESYLDPLAALFSKKKGGEIIAPLITLAKGFVQSRNMVEAVLKMLMSSDFDMIAFFLIKFKEWVDEEEKIFFSVYNQVMEDMIPLVNSGDINQEDLDNSTPHFSSASVQCSRNISSIPLIL